MTYGLTLKLDEKMDIVYNELNRFSMIEGSDKVEQDLEVLYRTHIGDDIFALDFGLDFAQIAAVDTDKVKERELEAAGLKYVLTKQVISVSVVKRQVNGVWKEFWSVSIRLLSLEEISTTIVFE